MEAALIDAYPGLTNKVRGLGANDYGSRHVEEIIAEHTAEEFDINEPLICICINRAYYTRTIYDAVRSSWKIAPDKARRCNLVLAHVRGLVVGAFRPECWLEATTKNFPGLLDKDRPGRRGFVGKEAEDEVVNRYVGKRVPESHKVKGAQNPIRYYFPP